MCCHEVSNDLPSFLNLKYSLHDSIHTMPPTQFRHIDLAVEIWSPNADQLYAADCCLITGKSSDHVWRQGPEMPNPFIFSFNCLLDMRIFFF